MRFQILNREHEFNVIRFRYIFFASAIILIAFKFYTSHANYKTYLHHRIEVLDLIERNSLKTKVIENGKLDSRIQSTYVIKAKSYLQYFILEFNPDERMPFSFYFLFNYLIIASIVFYALRNSSKEKIFTRELLDGLTYLRIYIIVMMLAKFAQCFLLKNYVEKIAEQKVYYYVAKNLDIVEYQFYLLIALFLITFVKEGIRLQMQEDLII
ncbi:MAG: hypothetical protein KKE39_08620 [Bacteroidetes bacterium]|nr:hypothetical protein [Bacteroidota bacterium]MBU1373049.1 hypothetical protein [Bacteroidota bacterium]MBU1483698.1 hypothetical protein [Bacteroidota bacterium]MBU2267065.1 hypothetical protein [Bacteroidota bacterium]MBU2377432.1 hypothetical protein [Bacteroidota bacterium]